MMIQLGSTSFAQSQQLQSQSSYMSKQWSAKANSMVKYQIEKRGITNTDILQVMRNTPRHLFVPPALSTMAYDDYPLPIGKEQTISQPYIVALMTDLLKLNGDEKILEIGTGSGYQTAILATIVNDVYSVETIEELATKANSLLNMNGYTNIRIKQGDGYEGWNEFSPFDFIIVTAAAPVIPKPLIKQLNDPGRMIIPVGPEYGTQYLILLEKKKGSITEKRLIPVRFVPVISKENFKH